MNNTKLLQRINELGKELNIENICELKRLYNDLEQKVWNTDDKLKANGYIFLMREVSYTLFDMIKNENNISCNESIRKMVKALNIPGLMVNDLVSLNNHVFVVGESVRNFSRKQKAYLIDDYLNEMQDIVFNNEEKKLFSNEKISVINILLNALNAKMKKLDSDCKNSYPYLFMEGNRVCYITPDLHIYLSNSLLDIANALLNGLTRNIEIVIEYNAINYYILNMEICNYKYIIEEKEFDIWTLKDAIDSKKKSLKK